MNNLDLKLRKQEAVANRIVNEPTRAERSTIFTSGETDSSRIAKRVDVVIDYAKGQIAVS